MKSRTLRGLSQGVKEQLIRRVFEQRVRRLEKEPADLRESTIPNLRSLHDPGSVPERFRRFDQHPTYQQMQLVREGAARLGIADPYFQAHDGVAGATTRIGGREYLNFSSYNYLGFCGDAEVNAAAAAAIDRYGTSVSASRLVSGERPVHRELEAALARAYGVEDCVAFVSGHATNVSTIGHLFGPRDLILHDALVHNSVLQGAQLSGAKRMAFAHNDVGALEELLRAHRSHFERALVVIEGVYSMDGDFPDLPAIIRLKERHQAFLMVDEAHSFGVMGPRGLGIRDHFGIDGRDVDIWMGTLSKTLAGCGGFIAGERALVEILKHAAPGFLYSVGMPPPVAAASLAALSRLHAEPGRVRALQERGRQFLEGARAAGIDTGTSQGVAVVPAVTGSSIRAARLAEALFERGINVQPIIYPAIPENAARLRFFLSSAHTEAQVQAAVDHLADAWRQL
ncbi:8-amino-7-oxononanoate synthase [Betaproteobacteria bacterium GR16-43]|nr:8-amino-7-oxononanoate synthase [Betaproteobacteria bacterium GR16-43]